MWIADNSRSVPFKFRFVRRRCGANEAAEIGAMNDLSSVYRG